MDAAVDRTCDTPGWDEAARLAALERCGVLDTDREPAFDGIAELAAHIFDAPIAVVNFVASDRQFFKAEVGIGKRELPLDVSICRHALLQPGLFVVPDLAGDARFSANPLVQVEGGLRFYAGALLEADGLPIGTVCVLDTQPRPEGVTARQGQALRTLAQQTMAQLELRRASIAVRQSENRLRAFVAASSNAMYRMSPDWSQLCENDGRGFVADVDGPRSNWIGDYIPDEDRTAVLAAIDRAIAGKSVFELEHRVRRADGSVGWTSSRAVPILGPDGEIAEWFGAASDVTDRVAMTERLRESEARFRAAIDAVEGVLWTNDASGRMVGEQPGWARLTGQTRDQYQAYGWADAVHPDDAQPTIDAWNGAVAERRTFVFEHRLRRADGRWRLYSIRAIPIVGADGSVVEWVGVHTDITEARSAEERLRESEERLALFIEHAPAAIAMFDRDMRYIAASRRMLTDLRIPAHTTFVGRSHYDIFPDVPDRWREIHARVLAGETLSANEDQFPRADGTLDWLRWEMRPWRDAAGEIGGAVLFSEVKTAEVEAKRALKKAEADLRRLTDAVPAIVYSADSGGSVIAVNARWTEYTGQTIEAIQARGWDDVVHPADGRRMRAAFEEALGDKKAFVFEFRCRRRDGEYRWFYTVAEPELDDDGHVVGWFGTSTDIHDRKEAEERERLLAREVDHRSKNLLGVVQSVVQLTRAADIAEFKSAVTGRIQALARTHGLLAASRWEGVELGQLVREELAAFKREGADRIAIAGPAVRLKPGAAQALALAVHELATNGAKYGALSVDDGRLEVTWRQAGVGDHLQFTWAESGGPGVSAPTRRGFGSTLIRSSVERQLNGALELDWTTSGLVCRMSLPTDQISDAAGKKVRASVASPPAAAPPTRIAGRRVLVVEDEALIALQIEDAIQAMGCEVVGPASSVDAALELLRAGAPDAAVLDINLGGEPSERVASALAALGVPFLFCTGYADEMGGPGALGEAVRLNKPLDTGLLKSAVRALLSPPG